MRMLKEILGEEIFKVSSETIMLSESSSGYTLQCSVDCVGEDGKTLSGADATWDDYASATTPANTQHLVNGIALGVWFKLSGNTDKVTIKG